jgi:ketosteroid isomerase-like protein
MIIFGTDMAEYWVGYQAARESLELQLGVFEDTEGVVRNQDIKVHASGEVAWFTEMIDMTLTSMGDQYEMTGWFSGIMEKRDGDWKIVQLHASKPVDGQAVAY